MTDNYLFGAVYIIEQDYTDQEISDDLSHMAALGFRLVTLWPIANSWLDSRSTGFVFSQTHKVLDICEKLGIRAILQLFGQNQAQEFMSDAVLTRDMMIHDEEGEQVNYNCFWANLNHPEVREHIDQYFQAAITEFRGHPAVWGWDVFNEAHFRSDDPYTRRLYTGYLRRRYRTIENLNRRWYRRYESFEQITPDLRGSPYSLWSSLLPEIEYERFRSENLTDICRFLTATAKKYDAEHPIIIDGTSAQIIQGRVTARNNDEFDTAAVPDVYGATLYPKSWGRNYRDTPWQLAMYFTLPASAAWKSGKPYVVNELQTHTQSALTPGSEVTPQELTHWILMCYFTGADAMQLWRWRPFLHGYQATGRGLTQMDGTPNRRSESAGRVLGQINTLRSRYAGVRPPEPAVRIAVSYRSRLFTDAFHKWQENNWPSEVSGWYRAFWRLGVTVGFADADSLGEAEMSTPVIVLPSLISVGDGTARWLENYVRAGGLLIADARLGTVDEWGVVPSEGIPGRRLSALFGVTESDVDSGGQFLLDGRRVPANFMHQILETRPGAETAAAMEDGSPAIVLNRFGRGRTIYFNSFIGAEMADGVPPAVGAFLDKELSSHVPGLFIVEKSEKVHVAFLQSASSTVMLAVNFDSTPQSVKLRNRVHHTNIICLTAGKILSGQTDTLQIPADQSALFAWET